MASSNNELDNDIVPPRNMESVRDYLNDDSFTSWPVPFIPVDDMFEAGLMYTGNSNRMKCIYCSIELDAWSPGDNPNIEHMEKSPNCPFFSFDRGIDFESLRITNKSAFSVKKELLDYLCEIGITHKVHTIPYQEMSTYDARLKTYENFKLQPQNINARNAEAGFFYIGRGSFKHYFLCFCCNKSLPNWKNQSDPWIDHARGSPDCAYMLLMRGRSFTKSLCAMRSIEMELVNPKMLQLRINNYNSIPNASSLKIKSVQKNLVNEKINMAKFSSNIDMREINEYKTKHTHDLAMCNICYKSERNIAFIPCGHVIACINCAFTMDACGMCRESYTMVLRVLMYSKAKYRKVKNLATTNIECSKEPNLLCKICKKEEMQLVFLSCRHVYSCVKCGSNLENCPLCQKPILATIQIYL